MNAVALATILFWECASCSFGGEAQRLHAQVVLNRAFKQDISIEQLVRQKGVFEWVRQPQKRKLTENEQKLKKDLVAFAKAVIKSHKPNDYWFFDKCKRPRKRFKSKMPVKRVEGVCFY